MPGSRLSKRSLPNFFKPAQRVEDLLGNLVLTRQRRLRDYIWLSLYPARYRSRFCSRWAHSWGKATSQFTLD